MLPKPRGYPPENNTQYFNDSMAKDALDDMRPPAPGQLSPAGSTPYVVPNNTPVEVPMPPITPYQGRAPLNSMTAEAPMPTTPQAMIPEQSQGVTLNIPSPETYFQPIEKVAKNPWIPPWLDTRSKTPILRKPQVILPNLPSGYDMRSPSVPPAPHNTPEGYVENARYRRSKSLTPPEHYQMILPKATPLPVMTSTVTGFQTPIQSNYPTQGGVTSQYPSVAPPSYRTQDVRHVQAPSPPNLNIMVPTGGGEPPNYPPPSPIRDHLDPPRQSRQVHDPLLSDQQHDSRWSSHNSTGRSSYVAKPKFNLKTFGKDDSYTIDEFISTMNDYVMGFPGQDHEIRAAVKSYLTGEAACVVIDADAQTWEDIKTVLLAHYRPDGEDRTHMASLLTMKRKYNETPSSLSV